MSDILRAALRMRVPVFPCGSDKAPLVKGGFKAATSDPETIRAMFANPAAVMIGVPTGEASGAVVVDIDAKSGGLDWWEAAQHDLPTTRRHRTRSGGYHLLWLPPDDVKIRNSASRIAPGVDVRGDGGYIIVPPSPGYSVDDPSPLAPMPPWLVALARERPRRPIPPPSYVPQDTAAWARVMRAVQRVSTAGQGQRNDTLNAQAYYVAALIKDGVQEADAIAALFHAARVAGLTDPEIKATLHSAFSAGARLA